MSQIRWGAGSAPTPQPRMAIVRPRRGADCRYLLGGPAVDVWLHWPNKGESQSRPCLGKVCPCHDEEPFWYCYTPAYQVAFDNRAGRHLWQRCILGLGQEVGSQLLRASCGSYIRIVVGRSQHETTVLEFLDPPSGADQVDPFDVRPHLLRLWRYTGTQVPGFGSEPQSVLGFVRPPVELAPPDEPDLPPLRPPLNPAALFRELPDRQEPTSEDLARMRQGLPPRPRGSADQTQPPVS